MAEYLIETKGLSKSFKDFTAVDKVNLQVARGEIYGFLGPNGAGKSTTIRMLLGLVKPTAGEVHLFGKSMKQHRIEILKRVGSMVEYPSYYGHLTATENLEINRRLLGADPKEIDRVLEIVRLTDVRGKAVKNYSLGMKQRLGIAQALLGKPELLILDEPTNGLDPAGIHEIRDLIKRLPAQMNMTVLVSSHILSEVELIASQVGIIHKGKMVYQGSLNKLRQTGESGIFLEAVPKPDVLAFLQESKIPFDSRDGRIFIRDRQLEPSIINRQLILKGHDVSHISRHQQSLEDIFLELTGGGKTV